MPILTPEERVGTTVADKYKLDRILAVGGMGTVYAGQHEWTHRDVAVKILNYEHARKPDIVKRFLQEARAAANLRHPNVVDVLDMGEGADGSVYLVLELLEGKTLKARMREGRIGFGELVELIVPVMDALAVAHDKGVIHRDLKPDNIFLADGDPVVPKLLDFGIAKVLDGDSSQTGTGVMIGTPQYMAPEQVRGDRQVGPAADIWSLGVVLFGALSGRLPFRGDSPAATIAKVLIEQPPKLRQVAPTVPRPVAAVVDKALSKHPSDRHESVPAMKRALLAARDLAGNEFETVTETEVSPVVPTVQLAAASLSPAPGTPSPGAPSPGAPSPGAPSPGAPSPGAPSPGAPSPGAPSPGAPSPGAPSPGALLPGAMLPGGGAPPTPAPAATAASTPAPGTPTPTPEPSGVDDDRTLHTPTPAPALAAAVLAAAQRPAPSETPSAEAPSETPYTWSTTSDVSQIEAAPVVPLWWLGVGFAAVVALVGGAGLTLWGLTSPDAPATTASPRASAAPTTVATEPTDAGALAAPPEAPAPEEDAPEGSSEAGSSEAIAAPSTGDEAPSEAPPTAGDPDPDTEGPHDDTERASGRGGSSGRSSGTTGRRGRRGARRDPARGTGGALILR